MRLARLFKGRWGGPGAGDPDLSMPVEQCRFVVLDTELTGLDLSRDSIVSLGAVAMTGGRIHLGGTFYEMVSPASRLTSASVVIHGITPSDVEHKPAIEAVIEDFLAFCQGALLVGHFMSLDMGFLNKELKRIRGTSFTRPVLDTVAIDGFIRSSSGNFSRHYDSAEQSIDLTTMAKRFNIPVSGAHNALMDAFVTAQLFQRFLAVLPRLGVRTAKDLLRIGKP